MLLACAVGVADDKADVKARYDQLLKAMKAKDSKAVMALGTKDMTWKQQNGQLLKRPAIESMMKEQFGLPFKVVSTKISIDQMVAKNDSYIVKTSMTLLATMSVPGPKTAGSKAQKPKDIKLQSLSVSNDTWVKQNGKWMLKHVESLKEENKIDGKKVN